ncbi:hypothetical protein AB0420_30590 [Streptomyces caelestis]|uniref:hypothetical protein n=1 Tax=Streptomyces caelestis TaxID=36816 RepID=UPI00344DB63C
MRALSGDDARTVEPQTADEGMSGVPRASGAPFTYGAIGGAALERHAEAVRNATVSEDVPVRPRRRFRPRPPADAGHRGRRDDGGRPGPAAEPGRRPSRGGGRHGRAFGPGPRLSPSLAFP